MQARAITGIAAAVAVAAGAAGDAGAVEFEPRITLGVTHTDNVRLASENEESEIVWRGQPAFDLTHETSRVTLDVSYELQAFRYQDLEESSVYHQYDASLRTALVPEHFFFEIGGNQSQVIRDPEGRIPQNNLAISNNRQDRTSYYATPSFQYALGESVVMEGDYRHTWVDYSEGSPSLQNRGDEQSSARFSIDNYSRGHGVTWALRYNWQRTQYDEVFAPWEFQQASAELGFWVGSNTRLFASGGLESSWDMPLDPKLEDEFWEAGFSQRVGERLRAEFAAGERTFGSSLRGELDFTFQSGSTSLSYSESPSTQGRQPQRIRGFEELPDEDDYLGRPGSGRRFIAKRLRWQLNFDLNRTGLTFRLFSLERTDQTTAAGEPVGTERQRGGSASLTYQLGPRTDLNASASFTDRELRDGGQSDLIRGRLSANYQLGPRTSLTLSYDYDEEDRAGEQGGGPLVRDYVANTFSLLVTRTF